MNGASTFELIDVQKRLGNFALSVAKLTIDPGETFGLLGPTGAGKSTLLRLLSGLDLPTSGRILFKGAALEVGQVPVSVLRRMATVPQRPLPLSASVRQNVEYGLRMRRIASAGKRVEAVLDRLGLAAIAQQAANSLSGGQLQLLALARAIVVEPEVLLLDEPSAHLDPAHVALVESVINEQQQRTGMTVVWASHNLFQARRVASRIGWLLDGAVVEVAKAQDFFENPLEERTKQFVEGRMVY